MQSIADTRQSSRSQSDLIVKNLGLSDYVQVWQAMQQFTQQRTNLTRDEIWVLQHHPVYTLGLNGKNEHIHNAGHIPLINTDRGGQVTYHGPGQLICYTLFDLQRLQMGVKKLVWILEQSVIDLLKYFDINGARRQNAPGVYVDDAKIAALGLRVRRHCSYHGLSLNINMDLTPFSNINPCGYADLAVTQLSNFGIDSSMSHIEHKLVSLIQHNLTLASL